MVADEALDVHNPGAIFAYHTAPLNVGQWATRPNVMMAWRNQVSVRLSGEGDLKTAAKAVRAAILEIGTLEPAQVFAIVTDADFIHPQLAAATETNEGFAVAGTITTASQRATENAQREIERRLAELEDGGVQIDLEDEPRWIAGVTNDPTLTSRASDSIRRVFGDEVVLPTGGVMPAFSEDFGTFQEHTPGVMFFLGVSNPEKGWVGLPHSPTYVADEESIGLGAKAMAAVLLDFLDTADR